MWRPFCSILLMLCVTVSVGQPVIGNDGLYDSSGDVVVLTGVNFDEKVFGSNKAWVVQFYLSWCGDCVNYVQTWKDVAISVKEWKSVISLAVVDCSKETNQDICNNIKICSFPTLLFMKPGTTESEPTETSRAEEVVDILRTIVDFLTEIEGCVDCLAIADWPTLNHIVNMKDLWEETKSDSKMLVAFVFESETSLLGREVILDMVEYRERIQVWRLNRDSGEKFGLESFPCLQLVKPDRRLQPLSSNDNTRSAYVQELKLLLTTPSPVQAADTAPVTLTPTGLVDEINAATNTEPVVKPERANADRTQGLKHTRRMLKRQIGGEPIQFKSETN